MKKLQHILVLSLYFCFTMISAQVKTSSPTNISIKGKITDQITGQAIIFGSIALYKDNVLLKGTESDLDGNYHFYIEEFGNYQIELSYVGYQTQRIDEIEVNTEKQYIIDVAITEGVTLQTAVHVEACEKYHNFDYTTNETIVTAEKISTLPTKNDPVIAPSRGKIFGKRKKNRIFKTKDLRRKMKDER